MHVCHKYLGRLCGRVCTYISVTNAAIHMIKRTPILFSEEAQCQRSQATTTYLPSLVFNKHINSIIRMSRKFTLALQSHILDPINPIIAPDLPIRLQVLTIQILSIDRSQHDIKHIRPSFRHRESRIRNIGSAPPTKRPPSILRRLKEREKGILADFSWGEDFLSR